MPNPTPPEWSRPRHAILACALGAISFHIAYAFPAWASLICIFAGCAICLSGLPTPRQAFYAGLALGLLSYAPQLAFFWTIFRGAAVVLWLVLAFWLGLFVCLSHFARKLRRDKYILLLIPVLWTGLEYFRSELYYLRFSWLSVGFVIFPGLPPFLTSAGTYGAGFLVAGLATLPLFWKGRSRLLAAGSMVAGLVLLTNLPGDTRSSASEPTRRIRVAGVQLEFPGESDVLRALTTLNRNYPGADLLVLSEYTFLEAVPPRIKRWCADHKKHLLLGAKDPAENGKYYNSAFVIDPHGEIIFKQAKSVPIQFFNDGLPAATQHLWSSPWGKIGICICYDLSYRRVVDGLVRQGAEAILVPTMDVTDWGEHQHELHAKVAPARAREYGLPIFRLCSSGISQLVQSSGNVSARAPFPGEGTEIVGELVLTAAGRLPIDHWLAPVCVGVTAIFLLWLIASSFESKKMAAERHSEFRSELSQPPELR